MTTSWRISNALRVNLIIAWILGNNGWYLLRKGEAFWLERQNLEMRRIIVYLISRFVDISQSEISRILGVSNALIFNDLKQIKNYIDIYPKFKLKIKELEKNIYFLLSNQNLI